MTEEEKKKLDQSEQEAKALTNLLIRKAKEKGVKVKIARELKEPATGMVYEPPLSRGEIDDLDLEDDYTNDRTDNEDSEIGSDNPDTNIRPSNRRAPAMAFWFVLVGLIATIGFWYLYDLYRTSAIETEKKQAAEEEKQLSVQEEQQRTQQQAQGSYRNFVAAEFPGWRLVGDDFDNSTLEYESRVLITTYLSKGEENRVVNILLQKLKVGDGDFKDRSDYWIAHRPNKIELGNIELEKITDQAFQAGRENP